MSGLHVAITGGAGFIGGNLSKVLLGTPGIASVRLIDDLSTGSIGNLAGLDVSFVHGSILDDEALDEAFSGATAVVHLAALGSVPRSLADPMATHEANATGTVKVLEAVRRHGGPHTIVASSSSVYGSNPTLPKHEELATRPVSPYAASKLLAEGATVAWGAAYSLPVLPLRFFNVFGPLQPAGHAYAAVIPAFAHAALRGEPLMVHGDGTQSRDFTYVGDVVQAIVNALQRRVTSPGPVNLAFGTRVSLLEVIDLLERIVGHRVIRTHIESRPGDVSHSQADSTMFRDLFPGLQPTPLLEGLRATVDWMRGAIDVHR